MKVQLSKAAQNDIQSILSYSLKIFGESTIAKYQIFIAQTIDDISADLGRFGVESLKIVNSYYRHHLKMSRRNVSGLPIRRPSHFIIFHLNQGNLEITHLLHERMLI